ncbi:hypothetical protein FACS1894122_01230 [Alphaproteobacteria bacterium]|nr:hypothetical protein FACS1894122_01230 [Alphaproteobacteria bacterium]
MKINMSIAIYVFAAMVVFFGIATGMWENNGLVSYSHKRSVSFCGDVAIQEKTRVIVHRSMAVYALDLAVKSDKSYERIYDGYINASKIPHGKGMMTYVGIALYEGDFVNGKREGIGRIKYINGDFYEGEFVSGKMHGKGMMAYGNGDFYVGDWVNGNEEGIGAMRYTNGDVYVGEWLNAEKDGKGKYTSANGSIYEGLFRNDEFVNDGEYLFAIKERMLQHER